MKNQMPNTWPAELGPVICLVGAPPNFIKMSPILRAFAAHQPAIPTPLEQTGQHYDRDMNDKLFEDLRLPHPLDINLEVGSCSHAVQTPEVMRRFEPVMVYKKPSCVLVVDNVMINSPFSNQEFARRPAECVQTADILIYLNLA